MSKLYSTQNDLLMKNLMVFLRHKNNNLDKILKIINGESQISLRLIDWFATNYSKKNFTVIEHIKEDKVIRTKVYVDYKLKLKAYSKKRFDPFCRWERINIPYKNDSYIQTTIGQLNFFRWALEYGIIDYIKKNFKTINQDMNKRNSTSKNRKKKAKNTRKKTRRIIGICIQNC